LDDPLLLMGPRYGVRDPTSGLWSYLRGLDNTLTPCAPFSTLVNLTATLGWNVVTDT